MNNEEQMLQEETFMQRIKNHLSSFWNAIKGKTPQEIDQTIISSGRTEEEKAQLAEMCEENRLAQQRLSELRELRKRGKDTSKWLENLADAELTKVYQETIGQDPTEEDKNELKQAVRSQFEADIEESADALNDEMSTICTQEGGQQ